VHEPYAAKYKFTSAMPAQLLKTLHPALQPLLQDERRACPAQLASAAPTVPAAPAAPAASAGR
jgi:hypothetical protein